MSLPDNWTHQDWGTRSLIDGRAGVTDYLPWTRWHERLDFSYYLCGRFVNLEKYIPARCRVIECHTTTCSLHFSLQDVKKITSIFYCGLCLLNVKCWQFILVTSCDVGSNTGKEVFIYMQDRQNFHYIYIIQPCSADSVCSSGANQNL